MANPPFNVDKVDAEKVKNDPRLPFGLPGVNNKNEVSNGNYLWISYFHSYLYSCSYFHSYLYSCFYFHSYLRSYCYCTAIGSV